jgi:hypothetical protein
MNLRIFSPGETPMAQMFCTLKQAAHKLETTEAKVETLIHDGVLREFRDGSDRLLKVADLAGLAVTADATSSGRPVRAQRKGRLPQPEPDDEPAQMEDLEIKLPSTAAATLEVKPPSAATPKRSPRPARQPASQKRPLHPVVEQPAISQRRQKAPRAVVICPTSAPHRPTPQTDEMPLRQWLWTGLLDDSPLALFIVFGTTLLGIGALAGAAYLLMWAL